ncbi:MAG: ABC transporter permease [Actinomycetota bacterium]
MRAPVPVLVEESPGRAARTPWQIFWRRFRRDRPAFVGLMIIIGLVTLALTAPLIVRWGNHHPPTALYSREALNQEFGTPLGPNGRFWFGADPSGRDLFSRILYGARASLLIALVATGLSVSVGVAMGLLGGYYRGWVDTAISRLTDTLLAFPILLLALGLGVACARGTGCLGGLVKPGLFLVVLVISFVNWPYLARIVRGQVLSLREREFIHAARMIGSGDLGIMVREILPNLMAPVTVYASLIIPANILLEAALSFLGEGIPPPNPSWGQMIADSIGTFTSAWWYFLFPGLFLLGTVLAFNLVGDGIRDALGPRH